MFNKFIDMARAMYDPDFVGRCQHFSFITYKNRIISVGKNSPKTHPANLLNPRYVRDGFNTSKIKGSCSELASIRKLKNLTNIPFSKCSLFNVRINNNGFPDMARPCSSCESLLRYFKFDNVFFTNGRGGWETYDGN